MNSQDKTSKKTKGIIAGLSLGIGIPTLAVVPVTIVLMNQKGANKITGTVEVHVIDIPSALVPGQPYKCPISGQVGSAPTQIVDVQFECDPKDAATGKWDPKTGDLTIQVSPTVEPGTKINIKITATDSDGNTGTTDKTIIVGEEVSKGFEFDIVGVPTLMNTSDISFTGKVNARYNNIELAPDNITFSYSKEGVVRAVYTKDSKAVKVYVDSNKSDKVKVTAIATYGELTQTKTYDYEVIAPQVINLESTLSFTTTTVEINKTVKGSVSATYDGKVANIQNVTFNYQTPGLFSAEWNSNNDEIVITAGANAGSGWFSATVTDDANHTATTNQISITVNQPSPTELSVSLSNFPSTMTVNTSNSDGTVSATLDGVGVEIDSVTVSSNPVGAVTGSWDGTHVTLNAGNTVGNATLTINVTDKNNNTGSTTHLVSVESAPEVKHTYSISQGTGTAPVLKTLRTYADTLKLHDDTEGKEVESGVIWSVDKTEGKYSTIELNTLTNSYVVKALSAGIDSYEFTASYDGQTIKGTLVIEIKKAYDINGGGQFSIISDTSAGSTTQMLQVVDENGNIVEVKKWTIDPSEGNYTSISLDEKTGKYTVTYKNNGTGSDTYTIKAYADEEGTIEITTGTITIWATSYVISGPSSVTLEMNKTYSNQLSLVDKDGTSQTGVTWEVDGTTSKEHSSINLNGSTGEFTINAKNSYGRDEYLIKATKDSTIAYFTIVAKIEHSYTINGQTQETVTVPTNTAQTFALSLIDENGFTLQSNDIQWSVDNAVGTYSSIGIDNENQNYKVMTGSQLGEDHYVISASYNGITYSQNLTVKVSHTYTIAGNGHFTILLDQTTTGNVIKVIDENGNEVKGVTFREVGTHTGQYSSLTLNADGTYDVTTSNTAGVDTYTIYADLPDGTTISGDIIITVSPYIITGDDEVAIDYQQTSGTKQLQVVDKDNNVQTATWSVVGSNEGKHSTINLNESNGQYTVIGNSYGRDVYDIQAIANGRTLVKSIIINVNHVYEQTETITFSLDKSSSLTSNKLQIYDEVGIAYPEELTWTADTTTGTYSSILINTDSTVTVNGSNNGEGTDTYTLTTNKDGTTYTKTFVVSTYDSHGNKFEITTDPINKTCTIDGLASGSSVSNGLHIPAEIGEYKVTKIADGAFRDQSGVNYINLTNATNLEEIGAYAFYGCRIDQNNQDDGFQNHGFDFSNTKLRKIGTYAFANCCKYRWVITGNGANRIRQIVFPATIEIIEDYAFGDPFVSNSDNEIAAARFVFTDTDVEHIKKLQFGNQWTYFKNFTDWQRKNWDPQITNGAVGLLVPDGSTIGQSSDYFVNLYKSIYNFVPIKSAGFPKDVEWDDTMVKSYTSIN